MKKLSLLFLSAAMITFASCGDEPKSDEATQAQLDSAVNATKMNEQAKADSTAAALQAHADSAANMQRIMDSVANAANVTASKTTTTKKNTKGGTTTTTSTTTVEPAPPTNSKGDKMSGNGGSKTTEDKKDKMSGNADKSNTEGKRSKMHGTPNQ